MSLFLSLFATSFADSGSIVPSLSHHKRTISRNDSVQWQKRAMRTRRRLRIPPLYPEREQRAKRAERRQSRRRQSVTLLIIIHHPQPLASLLLRLFSWPVLAHSRPCRSAVPGSLKCASFDKEKEKECSAAKPSSFFPSLMFFLFSSSFFAPCDASEIIARRESAAASRRGSKKKLVITFFSFAAIAKKALSFFFSLSPANCAGDASILFLSMRSWSSPTRRRAAVSTGEASDVCCSDDDDADDADDEDE